MCYVDDDALCSEVWRERQVRARKRHTCALCTLPIVVGLVHLRIDELSEGRWSRARIHLDCWELTTFIQREVCHQHNVMLMAGDLRQEVHEHMGEDPEVVRRYRRLLRARIAEGVWPQQREVAHAG